MIYDKGILLACGGEEAEADGGWSWYGAIEISDNGNYLKLLFSAAGGFLNITGDWSGYAFGSPVSSSTASDVALQFGDDTAYVKSVQVYPSAYDDAGKTTMMPTATGDTVTAVIGDNGKQYILSEEDLPDHELWIARTDTGQTAYVVASVNGENGLFVDASESAVAYRINGGNDGAGVVFTTHDGQPFFTADDVGKTVPLFIGAPTAFTE